MTRYSASLFLGKEPYAQKSDFITLSQMIEWLKVQTGTFRLDVATIVDTEERSWASLMATCKDGNASIFKYSGLNWSEIYEEDIEALLNH